LDFPELNGLEEVNKYSLFSPSSLLVVNLISVERMDSAFHFLMLAVFSVINGLLSASISLIKDYFFDSNSTVCQNSSTY
jgi:hypothetical protein